MPERAVIQDLGVECKASLCSIVINGDASILASATGAQNVQAALLQQLAQPPLSDEFDDQIMFVEVAPSTGLTMIRVYLHRGSNPGRP